MTQEITVNVTDTLEGLIKATSLLHVLTGLELVCEEKALMDQKDVKTWKHVAKKIKELVYYLQVRPVT